MSNKGIKRPIEYEIGDVVDKNLKHYINASYKKSAEKKKTNRDNAVVNRIKDKLKEYEEGYFNLKRINHKQSKSIDKLLEERGALRGQVSLLERKIRHLHKFYQQILKENKNE